LWAGNIEVHILTSDWYVHKHQTDPSYKNIILHVVYQNDLPGKKYPEPDMPHLELKNIINSRTLSQYKHLMDNELWIPCAENIHKVNPLVLQSWLERMLIERLETRYEKILSCLESNFSDWNETFHQMLARNFGFKTNNDAFERLARITPLKILSKHKNNLLQIEALLFGQAGMLDHIFSDDYPELLRKEYAFLQKKYSLVPMQKSEWKFARMHPVNFPGIRISQYANLIFKSEGLLSKVTETHHLVELNNYLDVEASSYWDNHYTFDGLTSKTATKKLGKDSREIIIINAILPFIFTWGKEKNIRKLTQLPLKILEELTPENNSILKKWKDFGLQNSNAGDSQALLHLKSAYCNYKKCLHCSIGVNILKEKRNFAVNNNNTFS
jgi:hypothetical protein